MSLIASEDKSSRQKKTLMRLSVIFREKFFPMMSMFYLSIEKSLEELETEVKEFFGKPVPKEVVERWQKDLQYATVFTTLILK